VGESLPAEWRGRGGTEKLIVDVGRGGRVAADQGDETFQWREVGLVAEMQHAARQQLGLARQPARHAGPRRGQQQRDEVGIAHEVRQPAAAAADVSHKRSRR